MINRRKTVCIQQTLIKEKKVDNSKPPVIVLSRNYSTGLGIIRSLGAAGYPVDLVASTKKKGSSIIASCSKYVRSSVEVVTRNIQGDTGSELIEALKGYAGKYEEKAVLFPTDDFTAAVVASNHTALKEKFLLPGITDVSQASLVDMMDKTFQGKVARESGLLTPIERTVSLREEITIPEQTVYPCFVKPLQSISGHKTEMAICDNEEELKRHLLGMKAFYDDREVLVQEYLNIDKEYDLSGVCLDQEIIIPAVIEKTRIAQHEPGVTMSGRMLSLDILGDIKYKLEDFLRRFHYVGMFDMELNLCGDKIYFNEVNLRSGGPNFSYYLSGVNLPDIFVMEITGQGHRPEEEKIKSFGRTFIYEKVAWEDYIYSYITKQELKQCIENSDFTLLANDEDPEPGKVFYKRIRLSALKHRIKIALGREVKKPSKIRRKTPTVVIAGRNYGNLLTMARDLGEAGYDVEVLKVFKNRPHPLNLLRKMKPEARSVYVGKYHECIDGEDHNALAGFLKQISDEGRKRLLIPVDDYTACAIDENLQTLREYYITPDIDDKPGEISRLMDKAEQKKLAAAFDLPMLKSSLIKSENGEFELPEDINYPCFIKPNISMKSTKGKMAKCMDETELINTLSRYGKAGDFEMLVEEFADIKAEYAVLGLSVKSCVLAPGLFRTIEGGHKERRGVAVTGETLPCSHMQSVIDKCVRFIRSLNYTGLFDVDLMETKDGKIYFVEVNFRAGASTHAFTKAGVNIPGIFADYLIKGKPVDEGAMVRETGKRFISEKVLMEEYARGDADMSKVKRGMAEADIHFVKDDGDPKPYRYFRRFYLFATLLRILYRFRRHRIE